MEALKQQIDQLSGILATVQSDNKTLKELNEKTAQEVEEQKKAWTEALEERATWERKSKEAEFELKQKVKELEEKIKEQKDDNPKIKEQRPKRISPPEKHDSKTHE